MPTSANADRDREHLASFGRLGVGVFAGSPLSMVVDRAIPKGREGRERGMEAVRSFVSDVQSSGLLAQFEKRVGLRGAVAAGSA